MAEPGDLWLTGEERGGVLSWSWRMDGSVFNSLAEGGKRGGGVLAVLAGFRADGRAEQVVEIGRALRGRDGVAASDVRLVHEALVAASYQRKTVPEEVLGLAVAVIRAGELAVDMVVVGVLPLALCDGERLVEVAVAFAPDPRAANYFMKARNFNTFPTCHKVQPLLQDHPSPNTTSISLKHRHTDEQNYPT